MYTYNIRISEYSCLELIYNYTLNANVYIRIYHNKRTYSLLTSAFSFVLLPVNRINRIISNKMIVSLEHRCFIVYQLLLRSKE